MSIYNNSILKIAVVGPESTGKSTMAKFLAQQFNTICVPEYARYYCKDLNNSYTEQDELNMFHGQIALEDALLEANTNDIIFLDTTILTVKIWSDYLFGDTAAAVIKEITNRKYDYYLLMDIDLPWEHDPLRDFPNERAFFLNIWKKELQAIHADYSIINSAGQDRLQNGHNKVLEYIKNNYK